MRTLEKNYTYLLLNIVPHRRLLPDRRRRINTALSFGDEADIRREAVLSLEDLVASSYLIRERITLEGNRVSVIYRRGDGGYRIVVHVPLDEWDTLFPGNTLLNANGRITEPSLLSGEENASSAMELFPKLIRSIASNGDNGTFFQKLNTLLERLTRWFDLDRLKLYLIEEQLGYSAEECSWLATLPEETFRNSPLYEDLHSSGPDALQIIGGPSGLGDLSPELGERTVSIPVYSIDQFWGILEVTVRGSSLDSKTRTRVAAAAGTISQVIENNVRLENLISIDKLTRIYNRHFYDMQLPIEVERATRSGSKLAMLLVDLDDFKNVNDELGHKKGDEALVIVADLIRKHLRKIDLPFRYGGEEFVILLPGTAQKEAIHTAERLRNIIQEYPDFRNHRGESMHITVSIGIAVFPDHATTDDDLFVCADKAMYKAKKSGKNKVEVYKQ